uniref:Uncharacterized protein n=1 Tax=Arundo donax TaxID=35708 RepID=A0A0A9D587_ARUDO
MFCVDWSMGTVFSESDASFSSSFLLAQAAILVLPSCVPRSIISLLVFVCRSCSLNSALLHSPWLITAPTALGPNVLRGVVGREQFGLVALTGVPVRDGSWLAIGVISVPISLIDTDRTVDGGGMHVVAL